MVDDGNSQDVEILTKRFKDYIDKVQILLDAVEPVLPKPDAEEGNGKFYTVVSPSDAMADNLKSVLRALERAIRNIEEISGNSPDTNSTYEVEKSGDHADRNATRVHSNKKLFSSEELDFLEKTFNKILKTSTRERNKIFTTLLNQVPQKPDRD